MRILFISDVYFPRVNGVSTSIRTFREELHRLGHATTLVAPEYAVAPEQARADGDDEGRTVRIPARPVPRDPEDRAMAWRALRAALARLGEERFDLVHVQTPFLAHYAGVRFAWQCDVPCVTTYHTFFEEYLHHYVPALPRGTMRRIARRFSRHQCNATDTVVVPSTAMLEMLRGYGVTRPIEIVPTGIHVRGMAGGDGAGFRAAHGIPPSRPMLLYVGRVAHEKNIDFLLRMFVRVRAEVPGAVLVVCGEGPALVSLTREAREAGLGDAVRFLGYLDRERDLPSCYAAADLFVFASRTETQGLVLLEALAAGTPVVAIAAMGTRDVLDPEGGARIAPDDEAAFARAVVALLRDRDARLALRAAAERYAVGWEAPLMAKRLEAVYARLVLARRAPANGPYVPRSTPLPPAG
jgi:glycosyltransferase involved in cell wall biosynthesis